MLVPFELFRKINSLIKTAAAMGRRLRFFLPSGGRICRSRQDDCAVCGTNFKASPFMQ